MSSRIGNARRAVVPDVRQVVIEPVEISDPGPEQVLVQTEASLISSGTELAVYTGIHQGLTNPDATWPKFPFQPGYAACGRVIAVGPDVKAVAEGDRIAWPGNHASHRLIQVTGGTWQSLPDAIDSGSGAFLYLLRYPVAALAPTRELVGLPVAVQGLGIIGQLAVRLYSLLGAVPVVGIDPVLARREAAMRGGADAAINPTEPGAPDRLREALDGRLAAVCVDATGVAQAVVSAADLVEPGGQVIVLGSPRGTASDVDMYRLIHGRSITLTGAHGSLLEPRGLPDHRWNRERALNLVTHLLATGRLDVMDLITQQIAVESLQEAYEGLLDRKEEYLAVLIRWG